MITDKEKLDAPYMPSALLCDIRKRKDGHWCWSNKKALDKIYERDRFIRAESAERARKEAAERVACAWREHGEGITLRILRDAILDDSTADRIPDTREKLHPEITNDYVKKLEDDLAIAVNALEKINERHSFADIVDDSYIISRDALKEMQG